MPSLSQPPKRQAEPCLVKSTWSDNTNSPKGNGQQVLVRLQEQLCLESILTFRNFLVLLTECRKGTETLCDSSSILPQQHPTLSLNSRWSSLLLLWRGHEVPQGNTVKLPRLVCTASQIGKVHNIRWQLHVGSPGIAAVFANRWYNKHVQCGKAIEGTNYPSR